MEKNMLLKLCFLFLLGLPSLSLASDKIIDAHLHSYDSIGDKNWSGPNITADSTHEEKNNDKYKRTQAIWDKYNITKGVVSGLPHRVTEWKNKDPERLVPALLMGIEMRFDEQYLNEVREMVKQGRIAVLGEVILQYQGLGPDSREMGTYFSLAEELDIPIAVHLGSGPKNVHESTPRYRVRYGNPLLLEEALIRHPDMRVYVMHAGWPFLDEMIAILNTYPQVYVDVAHINFELPRKAFHRYLRGLVEAGFSDRIMYGSDSSSPAPGDSLDPVHSLSYEERYDLGIENIRSADFLSEAQKRDIFYNNAVRFFRFEEKNETSH